MSDPLATAGTLILTSPQRVRKVAGRIWLPEMHTLSTSWLITMSSFSSQVNLFYEVTFENESYAFHWSFSCTFMLVCFKILYSTQNPFFFHWFFLKVTRCLKLTVWLKSPGEPPNLLQLHPDKLLSQELLASLNHVNTFPWEFIWGFSLFM